MKILKRLFLISVFSLLAICFARPMFSPEKASAATFDDAMFEYVTLSKKGQVLNTENITTIDNTSYIVTNNTVTITLKPFAYNYVVELNEYASDFEAHLVTINIEKDAETGEYADNFVYLDTTYYYRINERNASLNIYTANPSQSNVPPVVSTERNNIFYYEYGANDIFSIHFITSYTLKENANDSTFNFKIFLSGTASRSFEISFLKPVVEFANAENPIVEFTCKGLDAGNSDYVDTTIRREQAYNSVSVKFLNNDYTEENPLFFFVNYNGFVYEYKLYSKVYGEDNLLFVNYTDPAKEANNKYLATKLYQAGSELAVDINNKIYAYSGEAFNEFTITFTKTGRYQIDIYDSTYLHGIDDPNFYSTSFYIKDEFKSNFDNIYIIAQTQDDEQNDIEYIVSTSTLNSSVKATIKNLTNLGTDDSGNPVALADVIEKIEVKKTTFGGSSNIPTFTDYTPSQILSKVKNGDFVLQFIDDAYYQISIYKKGSSSELIYYEFTIVKHAKSYFTIPVVDEDGEPVFDEQQKQKTETYEATVPFKTETIDYAKNILSSLDFKVQFLISAVPQNVTLGKTYINEYTISYGMQQVKIEKAEIEKDEEEAKVKSLDLGFYGVGDLTVEVTVNGKTTVYKMNSEKGQCLMSFTEYGIYKIRLVDSMGTETTGVFDFQKKLNMSAIVLISLSALLGVVIVLFVLKARGKVATR